MVVGNFGWGVEDGMGISAEPARRGVPRSSEEQSGVAT